MDGAFSKEGRKVGKKENKKKNKKSKGDGNWRKTCSMMNGIWGE